jgi:hypothetical protein
LSCGNFSHAPTAVAKTSSISVIIALRTVVARLSSIFATPIRPKIPTSEAANAERNA